MKRSSRSGAVLILVLIVVALLSLSAYTFSDLMLAEREAAEVLGQKSQARALADSGVEVMRTFLANDRETRRDAGGIYDNEQKFRGQLVLDDPDPAFRGRFSVLAPRHDEDGRAGDGIRFGLENESARLNLSALLLADSADASDDEDDEAEGGGAARDLLMALPGMSEDVADAILDWIDEDSESRPLGAEIDYYSGLTPGYAPKNGPLDSIDELLLVRGVTPELLFGLDTNQNGIVDPHESGRTIDAPVEGDGLLDRGWAAYLTLHSKEANVNSFGLPRIYLNMDDMQQLHDELSSVLSQDWATFIVAYRQNGPYRGNDDGQPVAGGQLDLTKPARFPLSQVLDLVDQKVRVLFEGDELPVVLETVFPEGPLAMGTYLPQLFENVTVNPSPTIPGRVNINEAPRAALLGIPGMSEELADSIISTRGEDPDEQSETRKYETWLLTTGLVTLDEMKQLMPYVTSGGNVYRAQVVGYFDGGGPSARIEVIVDGTLGLPRLISWRDMSHLGRGHPLETLGIEAAADQAE